jgi:hypothetical protein
MACRHLIEAPGGFSCHIVEVGGVASDDRAQRHQAGIRPGIRRRGRRGRKFECTRDPNHVDHVPGDSGFSAACEGAFKQSAGNQLVVAADQNRHSPGAAKATGEVGHGVSE